MLRLAITGPPGAGKTSHAAEIADRLGLHRIGTGLLLRDAIRRGSPVGRRARGFVETGEPVPHWLLALVLEQPLGESIEAGFVLDGFPRTRRQAEFLDRALGLRLLDCVIRLDVPDRVTLGRIRRRTECVPCGRSLGTTPATSCDRCGATVTRRADDSEVVVRRRLAIHHADADELTRHYRSRGVLVRIEADGSRREVLDAILGALGAPGTAPDRHVALASAEHGSGAP